MSSQEQGYSYAQLTGTGVTLRKNSQCTVKNLCVMGTGNGTVHLYNIDTAAGTLAGNQLVTLALTSPTVPSTVPINANFNTGLVSTVTGTVNVGLSWN